MIPDAEIPVKLTVSGAGEMVGSGNASPSDMESVNNPNCKTYRGQALAILRPLKNGQKGEIRLHVESVGLSPSDIAITLK